MMRKSFFRALVGLNSFGLFLVLTLSYFTFVLTAPFLLTVSFSAEFTFTTSTLSWSFLSLLSVVSPLPVSPSFQVWWLFCKVDLDIFKKFTGFSCSPISSSILLLITRSTFSFDLLSYFSLGILIYSPNFFRSSTVNLSNSSSICKSKSSVSVLPASAIFATAISIHEFKSNQLHRINIW